MKLSFGTVIQDQPNYFIEKIWKGLTNLSVHMEMEYFHYLQRHLEKFGKSWDGDQYTEFLEPKIHTIRKDIDDLWHPGMEIIMVADQGEPGEFQFAPPLSCQFIQKISINKKERSVVQIRIEGQLLSEIEGNELAVNDGFQNAEDLYAYFNSDFTGKLVHWTSYKY